ncbi:hypothetical protein [Geomicrobium sp. JCM 19039]|uniref:DUF6944 family repetitive protein n=1 Tax=Geomicrobium sp. JCM 19039 TaxID=1460636 RepID=UPI00045F1A55|nr:hypothetical protein [Geomicrobium sp. JCM 19039]GAK13749.1 hypothetical protein JCM19039_3617 [Geomicrobium sp. JCM 19039]
MSSRSEVFAAWTVAVGTIIEAVASTERFDLTDERREQLEVVGVSLQAGGDALAVELISEDEPVEKVGSTLLTIGNLTILQGLLRDVSEEDNLVFNIQGNGLQALGGSLILTDLVPLEKTKPDILVFYGLLIEITGNVIQIISSKKELAGGDGARLDTFGAWTQALGSVLGAIGVELAVEEELPSVLW